MSPRRWICAAPFKLALAEGHDAAPKGPLQMALARPPP